MNIVSDLRFAQRTRVAVVIDLVIGDELLVRVHDVDEDTGRVVISNPSPPDAQPTRTIELESIRSVAITDLRHEAPEPDD